MIEISFMNDIWFLEELIALIKVISGFSQEPNRTLRVSFQVDPGDTGRIQIPEVGIHMKTSQNFWFLMQDF